MRPKEDKAKVEEKAIDETQWWTPHTCTHVQAHTHT